VNKSVVFAIAVIAVSTSAHAADLAYKIPSPAAAPVTDHWSGFYLGGNVGAAWSDTHATPGSFVRQGPGGGIDFPGRQAVGQFPGFNVGAVGATGGFQVGYNRQFAPNWVAGLEADLAATDLNKTDTRVFPETHFIDFPLSPIEANTESATQKLKWLGTVRGRLGFTTLDNRLLTYATGGLAYGKIRDSAYTIGVPDGAGTAMVGASADGVRVGWSVGGGMEYALANNWSAKLEYLYYDLGSRTLTLDYGSVPGDAGNKINYRFRDTGNLVRVGLNYRF